MMKTKEKQSEEKSISSEVSLKGCRGREKELTGGTRSNYKKKGKENLPE